MTILVIAEHDNKVLAPATLNTVAAAAKIGGDILVLVAGQGPGAGPGRAQPRGHARQGHTPLIGLITPTTRKRTWA